MLRREPDFFGVTAESSQGGLGTSHQRPVPGNNFEQFARKHDKPRRRPAIYCHVSMARGILRITDSPCEQVCERLAFGKNLFS